MFYNVKKMPFTGFVPNIGFNLAALEQFIKDKGIILEHYSASPSPIGLKDIGGYRRTDAIDTVGSGGFIYQKMGEFTGVITSNGKTTKLNNGLFDESTARLVIPKYYNKNCTINPDKEMKFLPGDKVYAKNIKISVPNKQLVEFNFTTKLDILQYPIIDVSTLIDSRNKQYQCGKHFKIDANGNIKWLSKGNPGIDPDTGKGSIYSIRYNYNAFWYVSQILNEVRVTNGSDATDPQRMPSHLIICREYAYHDTNRSDPMQVGILEPTISIDELKIEKSKQILTPEVKLEDSQYEVQVEVKDFK